MPDAVTVTAKATEAPSDQGFNKDDITPIASFVGLDTHNLTDTDSKQLKDIYDFVRGDAKEMTQLELLAKVRSLEQRLGMTSLGERRIDKMFRYVKIQSQIDGLEKQRDRELR